MTTFIYLKQVYNIEILINGVDGKLIDKQCLMKGKHFVKIKETARTRNEHLVNTTHMQYLVTLFGFVLNCELHSRSFIQFFYYASG